MGKAIFITGTDTGVGKTYVTCGLLEALERANVRVDVVKPFATGSRLLEGHRVVEDAELYSECSKRNFSAEEIAQLCLVVYDSPVSPYAAQKAGEEPVQPDWEGLRQEIQTRKANSEVLLVEGIGGVAVPLDAHHLALELAQLADCPALVVAHNRLGTVNHTLLTLNLLKDRQIPVLGFLFNESGDTQHDPSCLSNGEIIGELSGIPYLGHFPHGAPIGVMFQELASQLGLLG